jgi:phage terminase large subunit
MDELPPVKTVENPEHRLIETVFLPAFLEDNPLLEERDPGYRERLYQQGEILARALLEGDWSVFAGQFLSEFSYHRHVVKPFVIPRTWTRFRGFDWGFAAPACVLWLAKEPATGRLYIYNELYEAGLTDPQLAEKVNDMTESNERFSFTYADPSVWTKRTTGVIAKSTFDVFLEHQIYLIKADNNQERKSSRLRAALADIHDGEPGLKIFESCKNTIVELEGLMSDPDHLERPLPNQMDHAYDALCYALSNYSAPSVIGRSRKKTNKRKSPYAGMRGI